MHASVVEADKSVLHKQTKYSEEVVELHEKNTWLLIMQLCE